MLITCSYPGPYPTVWSVLTPWSGARISGQDAENGVQSKEPGKPHGEGKDEGRAVERPCVKKTKSVDQLATVGILQYLPIQS
jgi:hypothetical protein